GLGRLADRFRHLARLTVAEADPALLIADHHQRGKAEAQSTLHHFGDAVDVDELVDEFAVAFFASMGVTCHDYQPFSSSLCSEMRRQTTEKSVPSRSPSSVLCRPLSAIRNSVRLHAPPRPKLSPGRDRGNRRGQTLR